MELMSMDLNNIKRNNLDYLLTDILPTELSDRFTYSYFYEFLLSKSDEIDDMIQCLKETKAKPDGLFKGKEWASMPLKYSIMKDLYTVREISLVQPLAAIEMLLFVELYQKELLNLLNKNSCFSLRFHHKNNNLCYKNKNKSVIRYFSEESKTMGREVLEQTGMFFDISPYKSIAAFTSSEVWLVLNSKYKHFIRTDYKACFDSIYSHTFTWLIGKDSIDTKSFESKEDDAETPTSDVLPYLLKSHVVRYGSKAKQSIMNQLNELICNYPNKDRTIIAYFLSSILNHIGKNKDKCTIFKNDVKGSTVFSFLDLTFYAYSFFPNYGNTQKLLQIISYVRDEYDIFEESTRLQALINKYAFIFDKANINDVVNLFLFCRQAKIEIPYLQEECIVRKIKEKDDPILWATYLMYSQYNRKYSDEIRSCIEKTLLEKINAIRVQKSVYEYREFWWILIFNKCPFITNASQNAIDNAITLLNVPTDSGCTHTLVDIFKNYLQNSPIQFFDWDIERNDFLRTLTFKTHEKSIFKNYKENAISLAWGSI